MQNLPKHAKYKQYYKPNDTYWGLGVEHETYLETSKLKQVSLQDLKENNKRERYCVDYLTIYDKEQLSKTLDGLFEKEKPVLIPILMNSHSFQRTDINGEHKTTYERIPKPNPKFNGKTIFEWIQEENPDLFKEEFDKSYLFDGDTLEFTTQKFYKATVMDVLHELVSIEKDFLRGLNSLPREGLFKTYAPFKISEKNYGFASYLTNLKNNAMFNNGTIHINITLPTKLNESGEVKDFTEFKKKHQNYARAIQWLSPLIVAKYGSPDPLCESKEQGELFSAGSQRVAVSRYIGLGTYDTDRMELGKILTKPRSELSDINWYESFHEKSGYKFLEELGMDINFNKHYAHGIELRILDSLPISDLQEVMTALIYLADYSLVYTVPNPKKSRVWHKVARNSVHDGKGYFIEASDQNELYELFGIYHSSKEPLAVNEVYDIIANELMKQYKMCECTQAMIFGNYEEIKPVPKTPPPTPASTISLNDNESHPRLSIISKNSLGALNLIDNRPTLETIPEISTITDSTTVKTEVSVSTTSQLLTPKSSLLFGNILTTVKGELKEAPKEELKEKTEKESTLIAFKKPKWWCC